MQIIEHTGFVGKFIPRDLIKKAMAYVAQPDIPDQTGEKKGSDNRKCIVSMGRKYIIWSYPVDPLAFEGEELSDCYYWKALEIQISMVAGSDFAFVYGDLCRLLVSTVYDNLTGCTPQGWFSLMLSNTYSIQRVSKGIEVCTFLCSELPDQSRTKAKFLVPPVLTDAIFSGTSSGALSLVILLRKPHESAPLAWYQRPILRWSGAVGLETVREVAIYEDTVIAQLEERYTTLKDIIQHL